MNELIKITTNEKGEQLVSARELHEGLQIKSNFTTWIKRMLEYGFSESTDFYVLKNGNLENTGFGGLGTPKQDYIITLDMAKEISMIQRSELGRKFRQYFIECEKKLREVANTPSYAIEDPIERAKAWIKEQEEKRELEERNRRLIHASKTYTATELSKELGFTSAQALNKDLEEKKIQYKVNGTWVLCARYSDKGYTSTKQIELDNGSIRYDRRWTGTGRDWLLNEIYPLAFGVRK